MARTKATKNDGTRPEKSGVGKGKGKISGNVRLVNYFIFIVSGKAKTIIWWVTVSFYMQITYSRYFPKKKFWQGPILFEKPHIETLIYTKPIK